ncbi:MAG: hypothetical protein IPK22_24530 [Verrucomicrobiaceae bacterium]|nr:hypothetical protein [Verrucomicrobiaceae bacterium]
MSQKTYSPAPEHCTNFPDEPRYGKYEIIPFVALLALVTYWLIKTLREIHQNLGRCERRPPHGKYLEEDCYEVLLHFTPDLNFATYSQVEYWLANQGKPEVADRIHHAMRERELLLDESQLPTLRWTWKAMYFLLAGSGTNPGRLLFLHCLLFVFSWLCVFSNPASVEHPATFVVERRSVEYPSEFDHSFASSLRRILGFEQETPKAENALFEWSDHNGTPPGVPWSPQEKIDLKRESSAEEIADDWTSSDAIWVALNVQIPLIHLWARDEWEPASSPGYMGFPGGDVVYMRMEYETFAGLVQLFGYLTIPMLIAAGSRVVKRREPL